MRRLCIISLLKIVILDEPLHLEHEVCLADHVLAVFLGVFAGPVGVADLYHLLCVVFSRLRSLSLVIDVDASVLEDDGELGDLRSLGVRLFGIGAFLVHLENRVGDLSGLNPSDYLWPLGLVEARVRVVEGEHVAFHYEYGVVNVDGAFSRADQALEAIVVNFVGQVLLVVDREFSSWNIWVLYLLVLLIHILIHRYWKDSQITLLMHQLLRRLLEYLWNENISLQLQEAQQALVHPLLDHLLVLGSLAPPRFVKGLFLVVRPLAVEQGDLRLLAVAPNILLHVACLLLHVLVHHVVGEGHGLLGVLGAQRDDVVVAVAGGSALDLAGVAVAEAVLVHVHEVGLEDHFVVRLELRCAITPDLKFEVV